MKLSLLRKQLELRDEQCVLQLLRDTVERKIRQVREGECKGKYPDLNGLMCVVDNMGLPKAERNPAITKASFWNDTQLQYAVLQSIFDDENELNTVVAKVQKITGVNKNGAN
ncbi:hypothetical protein [Rheinheimera baltica]|uniref:hypothetical protein n=1 Tax=Rheinheimera baltica TaxID=67576 RepID=UPI0012EC3B50|nr:hypothetical protein [Rheinheimera baltica]